jgi:hypothetical protein
MHQIVTTEDFDTNNWIHIAIQVYGKIWMMQPAITVLQNHGRSGTRQTALPGQMYEENSNITGYGDQ